MGFGPFGRAVGRCGWLGLIGWLGGKLERAVARWSMKLIKKVPEGLDVAANRETFVWPMVLDISICVPCTDVQSCRTYMYLVRILGMIYRFNPPTLASSPSMLHLFCSPRAVASILERSNMQCRPAYAADHTENCWQFRHMAHRSSGE